jgi:hypothetical protein
VTQGQFAGTTAFRCLPKRSSGAYAGGLASSIPNGEYRSESVDKHPVRAAADRCADNGLTPVVYS